jgi:hypothetical protein
VLWTFGSALISSCGQPTVCSNAVQRFGLELTTPCHNKIIVTNVTNVLGIGRILFMKALM